MRLEHAKRLWHHYKIYLFVTLGLTLLIVGDLLHYEFVSRGGEFFIVPVLEHLLSRVENL